MNSINSDKIHITFWGTRGSISTPGRMTEKYGGNTPCVTIRYNDIIMVLDSGTGIRNFGIDLIREFQEKGKIQPVHLFLSHTHWDHIQGLPFFQPAYIQETEMIIYGSPKKERFLDSVLKDQMDYDYFPVNMSALTADIKIKEITEEEIQLGPVKVQWQEQVYHPGGSVRYRFIVDNKKIVYATDVELNEIFNDESQANTQAARQDYLSFIESADLLIADGQYTEEEYPQKKGWGHTSLPVLFDAASESDVKQLSVFHHDPQHSDNFLDELWADSRTRVTKKNCKMDIFWAREGLTLAI